MEKKFQLEVKNLKNIVLFSPETGLDGVASGESSIWLKISKKKLSYKILSFRYLLLGTEDVDTDEEVDLSLPLEKLQNIIKNFDENTPISFKVKDSIVNIEIDGIKYKVKALENDGTAQVGDDKGDTEYIFSKDIMLEGLKKTRIAMGDDEVRYYLNGINLELYETPQKTYVPFFVATNGHVLATYGQKDDANKFLQNFIIPKKVIPEVIKILERGGDDIALSYSKNKMNIKSGNLEILIKLVEAEYPDYKKVIPSSNNKELKIRTELFKKYLPLVVMLSEEKQKNLKLSAAINKANLSSGDSGNREIEVVYEDEPLETTLNAKYLQDILAQVEGESLLIKFSDGSSPLILEEAENKNLLYVVMPIRV